MSKTLPLLSKVQSKGAGAALAVALVCFAAGLVMTWHVAGLVTDVVVSQHRQDALAKLSEARARLEGQVGAAISLGKGLRGYVIQDQLTQLEFEKFGSELIDDVPFIRSIGLGPDNIIRYIYPLKGNEMFIGVDHRMNAEQWPAIEKAISQRTSVVSGPFELVQGGSAMIVRVPVFPPAYPTQPAAERSYWGMASLVIDKDKLFEAVGFGRHADGYRFAVRSTDPTGKGGGLIFGDPEVSKANPVSLPLILPGNINWEILGAPLDGWTTTSREVRMTRAMGIAITLVLAAMAYFLIREVHQVRAMALHDPLTGLANRRLLEDRMQQLAVLFDRAGSGFEIFYLDLDAFKPINDRYGHAVGDKVLIEVGKRLQVEIRKSDTVARVGGDEFIVLTTGTMTSNQRETFLSRLQDRVCGEFELPGGTLTVSASIGFAIYPRDAANIAELLRVADARMYRQKTGGGLSDSYGLVPSPAG